MNNSDKPLIERFFPIPSGLSVERGSSEYHRAVALSILLIIVTMLSGLFGFVVDPLIIIIYDIDLYYEIIATAIFFVVCLIQLIGYYKFANLKVSAMCFVLSYFVLMVMLILMSGGYESPLLIFLFCCPLIAFRIGGLDDGITISFFSTVAVLGFAAIDYFGVPAVNLLVGYEKRALVVTCWIGALIMLVSCLVSYELSKN